MDSSGSSPAAYSSQNIGDWGTRSDNVGLLQSTKAPKRGVGCKLMAHPAHSPASTHLGWVWELGFGVWGLGCGDLGVGFTKVSVRLW